MGAPAAINFLHFVVVPLACGIVLVQTRVKHRQQISTSKALFMGLLILFGITVASAILNGAGAINALVDFLLLTEPFLLLLTITCIPFSAKDLKRFKGWLLGFGFANLLLALVERVLIDAHILDHTKLTVEDNVQGVFYLSYGGHVVSANVSLIFCIYFFLRVKTAPLWLRLAVVVATLLQIQVADAKQVLLVAVAAWLLLIVSRSKNIVLVIKYAIAASIVLPILWWCIQNVDAFGAYKAWINRDIYGPNGDATLLKTGPLRIIPTYYESALNWFLGLGPGHTVGRLGGWLLKDYEALLKPFGATTHPVTDVIWATYNGNYLDSTMFSPFWGFAGVWGDLGFLGLLSYLYLWFLAWTRLCPTDSCRFILLNVIVNGFILTLMEEPGFMLSVAALIGLQWHEWQVAKRAHYQQLYQQQLDGIGTASHF
ncbi:hypothetical protein [Stenomitos frigidus]|nr:hypothetical protein [Stenomitos frigidus]